MLANNVPDKYAMKRMGHATNSMLKNVYQHIITQKDQEVTVVMNNFFLDISNNATQNATQKKETLKNQGFQSGDGGIRTHGRFDPSTDFEGKESFILVT